MDRNLTIKIIGDHKSGKTTIGVALRDFLRERGFIVEFVDPDVGGNGILDERLNGMARRLVTLANQTGIVIETEQTKQG